MPDVETNEEFMVRIMNFGCPTGALVQPFIIEAISKYSEQVLGSTATWDNGFIDSAAWRRTAEFVKAEVDKKYKPAPTTQENNNG